MVMKNRILILYLMIKHAKLSINCLLSFLLVWLEPLLEKIFIVAITSGTKGYGSSLHKLATFWAYENWSQIIFPSKWENMVHYSVYCILVINTRVIKQNGLMNTQLKVVMDNSNGISDLWSLSGSDDYEYHIIWIFPGAGHIFCAENS